MHYLPWDPAPPRMLLSFFDALDPDGNGVIELNDALQAALRDGVNTDSPKPKKKLTAAQRAKLQKENQALSAELKDMIHQFERTRGLDDPDVRRLRAISQSHVPQFRCARRVRASPFPWIVANGSRTWILVGSSPP